MENRHSWDSPARAAATSVSREIPATSFAFRFLSFGLSAISIALATILAGCGAPGDPVAPSPPVPIPVADLSAHQMGDGVALSFSLPSKTIRGDRLVQPPAIEILRGETKPDGSPNLKSLHVVETIPGELAAKYQSDDRTQIVTPIPPTENRSTPGFDAVFAVRTRASRKRASVDSNAVKIHIYPVPAPIGQLQYQLSESAIDLTWQPVTQTSAGDPIAAPNTTSIAANSIQNPTIPKSPAPTSSTNDSPGRSLSSAAPMTRTTTDKQFDFAKIYVYIVRSVTTAGNDALALESADSEHAHPQACRHFPALDTPRCSRRRSREPETTPPSQEVDLSWSINAEQDLAGYHVYRSEPKAKKALSSLKTCCSPPRIVILLWHPAISIGIA